jgi:hypothetical protein
VCVLCCYLRGKRFPGFARSSQTNYKFAMSHNYFVRIVYHASGAARALSAPSPRFISLCVNRLATDEFKVGRCKLTALWWSLGHSSFLPRKASFNVLQSMLPESRKKVSLCLGFRVACRLFLCARTSTSSSITKWYQTSRSRT